MSIKKCILKSKNLSRFKNIRHGVITKKCGLAQLKRLTKLNYFIFNRKKLAQEFAIPESDFIVMGEQCHTNNVKVIRRKEIKNKEFVVPKTDGLVTNEKGINLVVYTADCLPVLFYDDKHKVVAIAHAGRQGILKGVIGQVLKVIKEKFKVNLKDLLVYVGASIGPCHYQVDEKVAEKFFKKFNGLVMVLKKGQTFLNLWQAVKIQLVDQGVNKDNIELSKICTVCHNDLFYSARIEGELGKDRPDSNWSLIGIK